MTLKRPENDKKWTKRTEHLSKLMSKQMDKTGKICIHIFMYDSNAYKRSGENMFDIYKNCSK